MVDQYIFTVAMRTLKYNHLYALEVHQSAIKLSKTLLNIVKNAAGNRSADKWHTALVAFLPRSIPK